MRKYKLQQIDESLISNYPNLTTKDTCFFFGEYAGRQGFEHSEMNDLIQNFKKPLNRKDKPEWKWKEWAISEITKLIVNSNLWNEIKEYTWVPIPPSKIKSDPMYDDRLVKVLFNINKQGFQLDTREMLVALQNWNSAHESNGPRPGVSDHVQNLKVDDNLLKPSPNTIILFDDVITTGSNFKAAKYLLNKKFPNINIIGLFIARSIHISN